MGKNRTAEAIENYRFFLEKKSQQMSLDDWFLIILHQQIKN